MEERYEYKLAGAYVRGAGIPIPGSLRDTPLDTLTMDELETLIRFGSESGLKLYYFKKKEMLPRVKLVIGFLKGVQPSSLLDVGSGRGVFLFPFLREFPWVAVTSLDLLPHRVAMLEQIRDGGVENLHPMVQDICSWDMPENSFDVVTLLEVLEHIPNVQEAVNAAVRLARRFVVVTVPSQPDDNPEHIHLLTKPILTELFRNVGCTNLHFDGVNGHLFMVAKLK